ncbi:MAG: hypothetical protein FIA89_01515 [Geobacter sp.]|nr:hypothetical protein [Geobacter sp.]
MLQKSSIRVVLISALFIIMSSLSAWAGHKINIDNQGRNNVSVRFITINPNGTILNSPEVVHVSANTRIMYSLKDPCIYEVYVNGKLKMSPKDKTGLGLGCFNLAGFTYTLVIAQDESIQLQ